MADRLAQIENRVAAATPAPWEIDGPSIAHGDEWLAHMSTYDPGEGSGNERWEEDAALITNAPADLAALTEFVRVVDVVLDDHVSPTEALFDRLHAAMIRLRFGGES